MAFQSPAQSIVQLRYRWRKPRPKTELVASFCSTFFRCESYFNIRIVLHPVNHFEFGDGDLRFNRWIVVAVLVQRLFWRLLVHRQAVRRREFVGADLMDQESSVEIIQIDWLQHPCFLGRNGRLNYFTPRELADS